MAYTLTFADVGSGDLEKVGERGANLGELTAAGLPVVAGFCVTTQALSTFLRSAEAGLASLDSLRDPEALHAIRAAGDALRADLGALPLPAEVAAEIVGAWQSTGAGEVYTVRPSAVAPGPVLEPLPFDDVRSEQALLDGVRGCWLSAFTDRAIQTRIKRGLGHREILLGVVVQRRVLPEASGRLYTADPATGDRQVLTIEARLGCEPPPAAEALPMDSYRVARSQPEILERQIADKDRMTRALPDGHAEELPPDPARQRAPALDDAALLRLAALGQQLEAYCGAPQELDWSIADDAYAVTQSRPMMGLFPLPSAPAGSRGLRAYFCFNHIQGMTDPIPTMGLDLLRTIHPFGRGEEGHAPTPHLVEAGGRLYHDATDALQLKTVAALLPRLLENRDPVLGQALAGLVTRTQFRSAGLLRRLRVGWTLTRHLVPVLCGAIRYMFFVDPSGEVARRSVECDMEIEQWSQRLDDAAPGIDLTRDIRQMLAGVYPLSLAVWVPMTLGATLAVSLLRRLHPEADAEIDALLRAAPNHVTTEKDLQITDLAESIRHLPAVTERLRDHPGIPPQDLLGELPEAAEFLRGLDAWMATYGARAPSEIDISKPRYHEVPPWISAAIIAALDREPGSARARHRQLAGQALKAQERLLEAASPLTTRLTARLARVARSLVAAREQPKFYGIRCLALARHHLLTEGRRHAEAGLLSQPEDVWHLTLDELMEASFPPTTIRQRANQLERDRALRAPRVMTSDGECIDTLAPPEDLHPDALVGVGTSPGVVEGRARVVHTPVDVHLSPGDILITRFTAGWSPLFAPAAGLVTETGGPMSHASVVARDVGIPAIVGVRDATRRIVDGQSIRLDGDRGVIEVLEES